MKTRSLLVLFVLLAQAHLFAFWMPRPIEQLVWDAEAVVIGEFEGYDATKDGSVTLQSARFRIVQTFKGKIPASFRIYGNDSGICMPIVDFTHVTRGQYLMFLVRIDDAWHPLDATMWPVVNGVVAWREPLEKDARLMKVKDVERNLQRIQKRRPNHVPVPTPSTGTAPAGQAPRRP